MKKKELCEFGYLKYRKQINFIKMLAAFLVVLILLIIGLCIFKSRNNILTVAAVVCVLPAAKLAVGYIIVMPHHSASNELYEAVESAAPNVTRCYDCVFSNNKKPIGTQAVIITDVYLYALTDEANADEKLFEDSITEFLKNDKLKCTVKLYKDEKAFLERIHTVSEHFDCQDQQCVNRMGWIKNSIKSMCI
jgi:hypothetical protein